MTVAEILNKKGSHIVSAQPDDTIEDVSKVMASKKIGAVIVLDPKGKVAGILSERDVVRQVANNGAAALSEPISKCMTAKIITCDLSENINQAMEKMTEGRFRHLPVTDDGELVGIISIGDVVKLKIEQVERDAEDLKRYIAS